MPLPFSNADPTRKPLLRAVCSRCRFGSRYTLDVIRAQRPGKVFLGGPPKTHRAAAGPGTFHFSGSRRSTNHGSGLSRPVVASGCGRMAGLLSRTRIKSICASSRVPGRLFMAAASAPAHAHNARSSVGATELRAPLPWDSASSPTTQYNLSGMQPAPVPRSQRRSARSAQKQTRSSLQQPSPPLHTRTL